MAAANKNLELGTLFTGDAKTLIAALRAITRQMNKIATASKQLQTSMGVMNKAVGTGTAQYKKLTSEMTAFQKAAGQATSRTQKYQEAFHKLAGVFGKSEAAMRQWLPMLNKADAAIGKQAVSLHGTTAKAKAFNAQASRIAVIQNQVAGKIKYTADGWKKLGVQTDKTSNATGKATTQYAGFTKQISKVRGGLERVKAAFKVTASYGIAATAIYTVINAMKVGVQTIVDYDQALKNLQAITAATDAEVSAMGETIRNVASTTKFSTSEVAEGMVLLGQSGFTAGESMAAMQATANLATGTLSDMKLVTDLLTTTIRAFNLDTLEAARVGDVMANAINKSKLTIDKLRIAFNYIAATASQAGLSLEETAASMMVMANNGLRASTIGTGLRRVLSALIAPNRKVREAFQAFGIELKKINPLTAGWTAAIENLTKVLYNSETKTVDMSKAFELFQLRGAQAAAIIVKSYLSGDYQTALEKVREIGTNAAMAAKQKQGLGVQIKNLADRAKVLAIALGDSGAGGVLRDLVSILSETTLSMIAFVESIGGKVVIQIVAMTAALATATKVLRFFMVTLNATMFSKAIMGLSAMKMTAAGLATTMTGLTGKMGAFATAINYLGGPVLWVSGAVAGLIVLMRTLAVRNREAAIASAKATVEFKQQADILGLYSEVLKGLDKDSLKYAATLKRFTLENKELTGKIERLTGVIDLNELSIEQLKENVKNISQFSAELKKAQLGINGWVESLPRAQKALFRLVMQFPKLEKAQENYKESLEALSKTLKGFVEVGLMSEKQALAFVDSLELIPKVAEEIKEKLKNAFEKMGKPVADLVDNIKKQVQKLPWEWELVYDRLDALQKDALLKSFADMERRVAGIRKRNKDILVSEEDTQAQIDAVREKGLEDFIAGLDKEVEEARKAADKELEIRRKFIEKVTDLEQKLKADINAIEESGLSEKRLKKLSQLQTLKGLPQRRGRPLLMRLRQHVRQ